MQTYADVEPAQVEVQQRGAEPHGTLPLVLLAGFDPRAQVLQYGGGRRGGITSSEGGGVLG